MSHPPARALFVAAFAAALAWAGIARATPLSIDPHHERVRIAEHVAVLEDESRRWSIADVTSAPRISEFRNVRSPDLNYGFTSSAYWLRIELAPQPGTPADWILEVAYRGLDELDLYVPDGAGGFVPSSAGDRRPFTVRTVANRFPAFRVALDARAPTTIYLRAASAGPVVVPLELWSVEAFRRHQQVDDYALGILYGVLIALAVQSLLFFASLREPAYGWSFLAIAALVTGDLIEDGVAFQLFWPNWPRWENHSLLVFLALAAGCFIQFSRHYLDTRELFPRLDRFLGRVALAAAVSVPIAIILPYWLGIRAATLLTFVAIPLLTGCAAGAVRRHHRPARFYLAGLAAPFAGGMLFGLENLGWIEPSWLTRFGFDTGMLLFALLLSVGLADRVSTIRRDKERAELASAIDELTGIPNRRTFDTVLAREWARAGRIDAPISLIMADLDWFKRFNDAFGHLAGDDALRRVAGALSHALNRPADVVARFGGEEFAVVLPDTDASGALHVAAALHAAVRELEIRLDPSDDDCSLSISLGVATARPPLGGDPAPLVASADRALYRAKERGRNRIEVSGTAAHRWGQRQAKSA